jgi:hypothetical protein
VAKQIRQGMLDLAKQIGAMRKGKPDWYMVAEYFAAIAHPELLESPPISRPVGRPKKNRIWLVYDVNLLRLTGCTIKEACRRLADGECPNRVSWPMLDGTTRTGRMQMGLWTGKKVNTLAVDYQRALEAWREERDGKEPSTRKARAKRKKF